MKRFLFSMLALLSVMAINAQNWTEPSGNDFLTSTPIYVHVKVNGVVANANNGLEVAAFMNGECRAVSGRPSDTNNLFTLRVWGNTDEVGDTITFKVYDHRYGLLFSFNNEVLFTGETVEEVPYELNIDRPTGVSITNPISITTKFPAQIDLNQYLQFDYVGFIGDDLVIYEPLGESTIETKLSYNWTTPDGGEFTAFTIDSVNVLTATQSTLLPDSDENTGEKVMLTIKSPDAYSSLCTDSTVIIINELITPVTGIKCPIDTVRINKGESLYLNEELMNSIVIEPEDATNKSFSFVPLDNPDAFVQGVAMLGGTYKVKIVSDAAPAIYTTIIVEVYAPVESVVVRPNTFQAALGDNILDLVTPSVHIFPDDATNKAFSLLIPSEASDAIVDNVAVASGEYEILVVSLDNIEYTQQITVIITEITAPESIDVDINTNAYEKLRSMVTINPEVEDGDSYTITPKDAESAQAFGENGIALKNGTFTLVVTSVANPRVSAEVIVNVSTPVDITFPQSLTILKHKDTEFELTMTGDNFDPSLVSFEFTRTEEPMQFGIPTITTADDGAGLKWNIRGTGSGYVELRVLYDGQVMPRNSQDSICYIQTLADVTFNNDGWDWIYIPEFIDLLDYSGDTQTGYLDFLNIDDNNKVIEIRSQSELLYNDKTYGFIGTINYLEPSEGMYKIKAKYEDPSMCVFSSLEGYWCRESFWVDPGFTWIGHSNEWDLTLDELNLIEDNHPSDGDQLIGKTNFAEYSAGEWVGADFTLEAGKGYIYYNSADTAKYISFDYIPSFSTQTNSSGRLSAKSQSLRNGSDIWEYDASQFADNMAIVAEIAELENPEDYTIGAFVGDECRGMGKVVKDGKMMISVAGKSGETVSFRLHNEYTGEFIPLETEVRYSNRIGSLKSPLIITGSSITGVSEITTDGNDGESYYDLSGRKVEGNISTGVYVVKTVKNGQVIVKKEIKR